MFSTSDSSDSDDNNNNSKKDDVVLVKTVRKTKRSPPRNNVKKIPFRVPKRSVSPMANHPTFVRLKREREIEEKETEEDSSYPTSKKYRSETFARRFGTLSLNDNANSNVTLYSKRIVLPITYDDFMLDIGDDDDVDDDDNSYDDDDDDVNVNSSNNNNSDDSEFSVFGDDEKDGNVSISGGKNACNLYQDDPYTMYQFEKFQKRHQHNLSSSPLHRMSTTVSTLDGTITTVTIGDDKTESTVITTINDDEEEEDEDDDEDDVDDEDISDTRQGSENSSSSNSSCCGSDK